MLPWHARHSITGIAPTMPGSSIANGWRLPAVLFHRREGNRRRACRAGIRADIKCLRQESGSLGRNVPRAHPGAALVTAPAGRTAGGVLADSQRTAPVLACRLTEDHLLLLAATTDAAPVARQLANLREIRTLIQHDVTTALRRLSTHRPAVETPVTATHAARTSPRPPFPRRYACRNELAGVQGPAGPC